MSIYFTFTFRQTISCQPDVKKTNVPKVKSWSPPVVCSLGLVSAGGTEAEKVKYFQLARFYGQKRPGQRKKLFVGLYSLNGAYIEIE